MAPRWRSTLAAFALLAAAAGDDQVCVTDTDLILVVDRSVSITKYHWNYNVLDTLYFFINTFAPSVESNVRLGIVVFPAFDGKETHDDLSGGAAVAANLTYDADSLRQLINATVRLDDESHIGTPCANGKLHEGSCECNPQGDDNSYGAANSTLSWPCEGWHWTPTWQALWLAQQMFLDLDDIDTTGLVDHSVFILTDGAPTNVYNDDDYDYSHAEKKRKRMRPIHLTLSAATDLKDTMSDLGGGDLFGLGIGAKWYDFGTYCEPFCDEGGGGLFAGNYDDDGAFSGTVTLYDFDDSDLYCGATYEEYPYGCADGDLASKDLGCDKDCTIDYDAMISGHTAAIKEARFAEMPEVDGLSLEEFRTSFRRALCPNGDDDDFSLGDIDFTLFPTADPYEPTVAPTPRQATQISKPTPSPEVAPVPAPTPSPVPAPTPSPDAAPTPSPDAAPTAAPALAPVPAPTTPAPSVYCEDDPSWHVEGKPDKDCAWLSENVASRCGEDDAAKLGEDGTWGDRSCPAACGLCEPTAAPTGAPASAPTAPPTVAPTPRPTPAPTVAPTKLPTLPPTAAPAPAPTAAPTRSPTVAPTRAPTVAPSEPPSRAPTTVVPSARPTPAPSTEVYRTSLHFSVDAWMHSVGDAGCTTSLTEGSVDLNNRRTLDAAYVAAALAVDGSSVRVNASCATWPADGVGVVDVVYYYDDGAAAAGAAGDDAAGGCAESNATTLLVVDIAVTADDFQAMYDAMFPDDDEPTWAYMSQDRQWSYLEESIDDYLDGVLDDALAGAGDLEEGGAGCGGDVVFNPSAAPTAAPFFSPRPTSSPSETAPPTATDLVVTIAVTMTGQLVGACDSDSITMLDGTVIDVDWIEENGFDINDEEHGVTSVCGGDDSRRRLGDRRLEESSASSCDNVTNATAMYFSQPTNNDDLTSFGYDYLDDDALSRYNESVLYDMVVEELETMITDAFKDVILSNLAFLNISVDAAREYYASASARRARRAEETDDASSFGCVSGTTGFVHPSAAPSAPPTIYACEDRPSWHVAGVPSKGCAWVGANAGNRCGETTTDDAGETSLAACAASCGLCPTPAPTAAPSAPPSGRPTATATCRELPDAAVSANNLGGVGPDDGDAEELGVAGLYELEGRTLGLAVAVASGSAYAPGDAAENGAEGDALRVSVADGTEVALTFTLAYDDGTDVDLPDGMTYEVTILDLGADGDPPTRRARVCVDDDQYLSYGVDANTYLNITTSAASCDGARDVGSVTFSAAAAGAANVTLEIARATFDLTLAADCDGCSTTDGRSFAVSLPQKLCDGVCEDDPDWHVDGKAEKGCAWVAENPASRCDEGKVGWDGTSSDDACLEACGVCYTAPPTPTVVTPAPTPGPSAAPSAAPTESDWCYEPDHVWKSGEHTTLAYNNLGYHGPLYNDSLPVIRVTDVYEYGGVPLDFEVSIAEGNYTHGVVPDDVDDDELIVNGPQGETILINVMDGTQVTVNFRLFEDGDPSVTPHLDGNFYLTVFDLDTQWDPAKQRERLCVDDDQYAHYILTAGPDEIIVTHSEESCTGNRRSSSTTFTANAPGFYCDNPPLAGQDATDQDIELTIVTCDLCDQCVNKPEKLEGFFPIDQRNRSVMFQFTDNIMDFNLTLAVDCTDCTYDMGRFFNLGGYSNMCPTYPSAAPTVLPGNPSRSPVAAPTAEPTAPPTVVPGNPTRSPVTRPPTAGPTAPTAPPTVVPGNPSRSPVTRPPSPSPSAAPTTAGPTAPTAEPTAPPTTFTRAPTVRPTVDLCYPPDTTYTVSSTVNVSSNNLGGQGPLDGEPIIRVNDLMDFDGRVADMLVTVAEGSSYQAGDSGENGASSGTVAVSVLDDTNVTLNFGLYYQDDGAPVDATALVDGFYLSVLDIDHQKTREKQDERVCVDDDQYSAYVAGDDIIVIKSDTSCVGDRGVGSTYFIAGNVGFACDNPEDVPYFTEITCDDCDQCAEKEDGSLDKYFPIDQAARAILFAVTPGVANMNITVAVACTTCVFDGGRSVLFGGWIDICDDPTPRPSLTASPTKTRAPAATPTTADPSASPSGPTYAPTVAGDWEFAPSRVPRPAPSASPTSTPSTSTTSPTAPSATPTVYPGDPTRAPIPRPTAAPSAGPSAAPSPSPSPAPSTATPSTAAPSTSKPTYAPTALPGNPTRAPAAAPTGAPSLAPSTAAPSAAPTALPGNPTRAPAPRPSAAPTTAAPSAAPTETPVEYAVVIDYPVGSGSISSCGKSIELDDGTKINRKFFAASLGVDTDAVTAEANCDDDRRRRLLAANATNATAAPSPESCSNVVANISMLDNEVDALAGSRRRRLAATYANISTTIMEAVVSHYNGTAAVTEACGGVGVDVAVVYYPTPAPTSAAPSPGTPSPTREPYDDDEIRVASLGSFGSTCWLLVIALTVVFWPVIPLGAVRPRTPERPECLAKGGFCVPSFERCRASLGVRFAPLTPRCVAVLALGILDANFDAGFCCETYRGAVPFFVAAAAVHVVRMAAAPYVLCHGYDDPRLKGPRMPGESRWRLAVLAFVCWTHKLDATRLLRSDARRAHPDLDYTSSMPSLDATTVLCQAIIKFCYVAKKGRLPAIVFCGLMCNVCVFAEYLSRCYFAAAEQECDEPKKSWADLFQDEAKDVEVEEDEAYRDVDLNDATKFSVLQITQV